jgi:hypothetical protein
VEWIFPDFKGFLISRSKAGVKGTVLARLSQGENLDYGTGEKSEVMHENP